MTLSQRIQYFPIPRSRSIEFALLGVTVLAGCERAAKPTLPVFPVQGRVLVDGQPPVRAEIRMRPKTPLKDPLKRSVEPHAFVQEDGSFRVSTYADKDGAPVGEYALTIVWPEITEEGGEDVIGEDRLRGRFSDPQSPIAQIEVDEFDNHIPDIELTTR